MEDNNLYIPANIKTRLEFFRGYGVKELVTTIIVVAFFLPIIVILYKCVSTLTAIVFMLVIIAVTVVSLTKDENNLSVVKQIGFMIKSAKMQKKFKYKYYDKRRDFN